MQNDMSAPPMMTMVVNHLCFLGSYANINLLPDFQYFDKSLVFLLINHNNSNIISSIHCITDLAFIILKKFHKNVNLMLEKHLFSISVQFYIPIYPNVLLILIHVIIQLIHIVSPYQILLCLFVMFL